MASELLQSSSSHEADALSPSLDGLPVDLLNLIFSYFSPTELCRVAATSRFLFEHAGAEALWAGYLDQKWGALALSECTVDTLPRIAPHVEVTRGITGEETSRVRTDLTDQPRVTRSMKLTTSPSLRRFSLLELGRTDFPVQILNCEQNLGFPLSAYDARARYLGPIAGFEVRYQGPVYDTSLEAPMSLVETGVQQTRLRAPPTWGDNGAHEVYTGRGTAGEGLELAPGEYVEVQWRVHRDMPFIWWFGEVAHFAFCPNKPPTSATDRHTGSEGGSSCSCLRAPCVIVEFRAYGFGFPKQRVILDTAVGGELELRQFSHGFMGGIRKVSDRSQILAWLAYGLLHHCS